MRVRLTVERLRMLVLVTAALLVVALAGFLAVAKWRNPLTRKDLPNKLGIHIQQEVNGWTYTHERRGHTLYKIHASKMEQLTAEEGGRVLLHDVQIELYGEDGSRLDRIEGKEFEYDQRQGLAKAQGAVEIVVTRPGAPLALAPETTGEQVLGDRQKGTALAAAAHKAESGEIHIKTHGLLFEQKSGTASTSERVDFSLVQGQGSAQGATFEAGSSRLVLEHEVEFRTRRGNLPITLHASRAEFQRDERICLLHNASLEESGGQATAGEAKILFREDGSAARLEAAGNFTVTTPGGSRLTAPAGQLELDEHTQPRRGTLTGGVTLDSVSSKSGKRSHGSAPKADLTFTEKGVLRQVHLERGVELRNEDGGDRRLTRNWRSPVADLTFRETAKGHVELTEIHGTEGVQVTSQGAKDESPSRLAADDLRGDFAPGGLLRTLTGTGHTLIEQSTANGAHQQTTGDRLEAHLAQASGKGRTSGMEQIELATVDGHVTLLQTPRARSGAQASPLRATAGRAQFEGNNEWLHLTLAPRVTEGGVELSASRIDFSQQTGQVLAHGGVKATWTDTRSAASGQGGPALGGRGPVHVAASEAHLRHEATAGGDMVTFTGKARLWQESNSIDAPEIVLDRARMVLTAKTTQKGDPVRAVFLSATPATQARKGSVVRVQGGDLLYSDRDRHALMLGGALSQVTAQTLNATTTANEMDLQLTPQGQTSSGPTQAQLERLVASGRVTIAAQARRGAGERLEYTGQTGEYTLTGTAAAPPRVVDPARGAVSGDSLTFHAGDDSVTVQGGARKARIETTAPR